MISQDKVRAAAIGLFMKALIAEGVEPNKRVNQSANKIGNKVAKYINRNFRTKEDKELLAEIANNAWDKACDIGEGKLLAVSTLCMEMYDSQYKALLEKEIGITSKLIQNFYNSCRGDSTIKVKIDSKAITKVCLQSINKTIYDKYKTNSPTLMSET